MSAARERRPRGTFPNLGSNPTEKERWCAWYGQPPSGKNRRQRRSEVRQEKALMRSDEREMRREASAVSPQKPGLLRRVFQRKTA